MDKRMAFIVTGIIIAIIILCFTVIFPFIRKQLHASVPPSIEKIESTAEKPQRAIPTYILDDGQKIQGTSGN